MKLAKKLLAATSVVLSVVLLLPPADAQGRSESSPPSISEGTPYPQVRQRLRGAGWQPYRLPRPSSLGQRRVWGCEVGDARCHGFQETIFCTATGSATCWYSWRRGGSFLLVAASGEAEGQYYDEARACSSIVFSDEQHPWRWCRNGRASGAAMGQGNGLADIPSVALTNVNGRYGPGESFPRALTLRSGERISVDSALNGWCLVNSAENMWANCTYLRPPVGGWVPGKTIKRARWPRQQTR